MRLSVTFLMLQLQTPNVMMNPEDVAPGHLDSSRLDKDYKYPEGTRYTFRWIMPEDDVAEQGLEERAVNNSYGAFVSERSPLLCCCTLTMEQQ
jgi:hypothetical protein